MNTFASMIRKESQHNRSPAQDNRESRMNKPCNHKTLYIRYVGDRLFSVKIKRDLGWKICKTNKASRKKRLKTICARWKSGKFTETETEREGERGID